MKHANQKDGQSLIEVVVAVGLVTIVLAALISAISYSLNNLQYTRNKAQANKYAQQAIEWLRTQRDDNWDAFYANASEAGSEYCMKQLALTSHVGCDLVDDDYDIFTRTVKLESNGYDGVTDFDDRVKVTVKVSWPQSDWIDDVTLVTYLTKW